MVHTYRFVLDDNIIEGIFEDEKLNDSFERSFMAELEFLQERISMFKFLFPEEIKPLASLFYDDVIIAMSKTFVRYIVLKSAVDDVFISNKHLNVKKNIVELLEQRILHKHFNDREFLKVIFSTYATENLDADKAEAYFINISGNFYD